MIDRRAFLAGSTATAALAALPVRAAAPSPLVPLFDGMVEAQLQRSPEGATSLGLDTGARAALRSRLSDQSLAGVAAQKSATAADIAALEAVDRASLSPVEAIDLDSVLYARRSAAAVQAFPYGGSGYGPSPYVVSQQAGAYQSVPDFLDTKHPLNDAADADAYLARVTGFAAQLDAQTERMRHDAGLGVVPPDFVLDLSLAQMGKLRVPAADALIVTSIGRRGAAKGLPGRYAEETGRRWTAEVLPALDRQIAQAKALRGRATHDAGVWKQPQGDAFYRAALRATTTTARTPEEVHRFGQEQARAIAARLDTLLKAQGYGKGSVGARLKALTEDPRYLFPDTDEGKRAIIAFCNERLAAIRSRLPQVFERMPPYQFEVRRVPPQTEAGAAGAFAQAPAIDGSRPGLVYFNLRTSADWPRFDLVTTTYHEGLPGHQMESGLALANTRLPLIRKLTSFSGYGEGWALYSEQLADEIGMYDDDPLGRIGYLKAQLFRANRCIVDTGIHHYRWSRERAIAFFIEQQGDTPGDATREIERYCVNPGQACSYKLGHSTFVDIRERAKAKLGPRFDLKAFHTMVLANGRVPLDILRRMGDAWIAAA